MEITPDEKQIADLLSKLKKSNGAYPADMLASRRQRYVQQVANAGLGIGIGSGLNKILRGNGGATTTVTSKIVEAVLITAIVIEAGTVAYLYRGRIAELVRSATTSEVQQVAPQSNNNSESNPALSNETEASIVGESETPVETPSTTPAVGATNSNGNSNGTGTTNNNGSSNTTVNGTPVPGGNNGNQFGLTPKPERTKDNDSDSNNNSDGNNNNGGGGQNNKP